MKFPQQICTVLSLVLLSLFMACSKEDRTIGVENNDLEMTAAIAKARATLPEFWQVFDKREHGETHFALKVMIRDKGNVEHFWANEIERKQGKIKGTINNDPNQVTTVKMGDRIDISETDISDWFYFRDGKMVGNRTLVPLFKKMPADEVEKYKKIMAAPEGK